MPAPFPTNDEVAAMPVDRLAMHVLWYLADTDKYHRRVEFIFARLRENHRPTPSSPQAYVQDANDLATPPARAWAEAWEWVIARGLVTANLAHNSDYWAISRRGRQVAAEAEPLVHLSSSARLDVDLHPRIASTVRSLFSQGLYDLAAFEAMKQVEIRVRELAKAGAGEIGVPLMRHAFRIVGGPQGFNRRLARATRPSDAAIGFGRSDSILDPADAEVLRVAHAYRNDAYHEDRHPSTIGTIASAALHALVRGWKASLPSNVASSWGAEGPLRRRLERIGYASPVPPGDGYLSLHAGAGGSRRLVA